jgi:hypothetical protein
VAALLFLLDHVVFAIVLSSRAPLRGHRDYRKRRREPATCGAAWRDPAEVSAP